MDTPEKHGGPGGENAGATGHPHHAGSLSPAGVSPTISLGNAASVGELIPDTAAAVDFLQRFAPAGPWALTAIVPDGKTFTQIFRPAQLDSMREWIDAHQGQRNIYFHVNPVSRDINKKAEKTDIRELAWLHVDIDPRPGEDPAEEKVRALKKLSEFSPLPTIVIDSGGGVQGFWRLQEPLPTDGSAERCEELEAYNIQLERLFGADACHNIDRVMRLPGTINLPNARKLKKGRKPALASVVDFNDHDYPISMFTAAPVIQTSSDGGLSAKPRIVISGNVPRLADIEDLNQWNVPDYVKMLIVQGCDPDDSTKYGSRSEALFRVCCELVRSTVPDETIYAVITDPDFGIAASVLDKPRPEKYALRQIEQAHAKVAAEPAPERPLLINKKSDLPLCCQENIEIALDRMGVRLARDRFARRDLIQGPDDRPQRHLGDEEIDDLWLHIDRHFKFRPAIEFFTRTVQGLARANGFHPVTDYLDELTWDGIERLDRWLVTYGKAEDSEYVRTVGALVLIAAVRRVRRPGAKFDEMLVLEGEQGNQKSTALLILAGNRDWFSDDLPLNADSKTVIERLSGKWIVEAGELKGMRKGDIDSLKSMLSRQVDEARLAYGRVKTEVPRSCVIIGTTNSKKYLKDPTGNRRFWPTSVGVFDLATLKADRDQLWAEAAVRERDWHGDVRLPERLWPVAAAQQEERRMADGVELELERRLGERVGKIRCTDVYDLLRVPMAQRNQDWAEGVTAAMARLGWEKSRLRFDGSLAWCFAKGTPIDRATILIPSFGPDGISLIERNDGSTAGVRERQARVMDERGWTEADRRRAAEERQALAEERQARAAEARERQPDFPF